MNGIRRCDNQDLETLLAIINSAAEAYRGVIPVDRWHDPYMSLAALHHEISSGVAFSGLEIDGSLVGVMGVQPVRDVDLIRHAYVLPSRQRQGIGAALIEHLRCQSTRRMLVGTWAAASWAIEFYRRHGFELVAPRLRTELLRTYWSIPARQIESSVVLANPPLL